MSESEELALYQTTTAWAYEFLLGIDQQLNKASTMDNQSLNSTNSQTNGSER